MAYSITHDFDSALEKVFVRNLQQTVWLRLGISQLSIEVNVVYLDVLVLSHYSHFVDDVHVKNIAMSRHDERFVAVQRLDFSHVTCLLKVTSHELLLEEVHVPLLDWVDSARDVPQDESVARWDGLRTFVNPSLTHVNHLHELANWDMIDNRVVLFPSERIKEFVNDSDHFVCNTFNREAFN